MTPICGAYKRLEFVMIFKSIMLPGLICLGIFSGCGDSQPGGGIKVSDLSEEQIVLVREYIKLKAIGMDGKVDRFVEMRDDTTLEIITDYLARKKRPIDSERVESWATNWPEVAGLPIVQDSIKDRWRRMVFKRPTVFGDDGVEKAVYPVLLFGLNGETWRVSNGTMVGNNIYNPDSTLRTTAQFNYHPMFRLPPDFRDLLPRDSTRPKFKPQPLPEEDIRRYDSLRDAAGR